MGVPDGLPVPMRGNRVPVYPNKARDQRWEGTVVIEMNVDEVGRVTSARVLHSSGHDLLDQEALRTARTWTFEPARLNGQPVPVTVNRHINFSLK